jgi:hypothetical protein
MAMTPITAADIVKLLRAKYTGREYIVMEEVPDGTGRNFDREIDVAVFSMWPSNGLNRSAFEIKVSRQDFLHELAHPEKHQWVRDSFHEFWFVAPKDIIQLEELPDGAGFMYPMGSKLGIARNARRNDSPVLNDILLAAFMRSAAKSIQKTQEITANDILSNDSGYQEAKLYKAAVEFFLSKRGVYDYLKVETKEDVVKALEGASMDKQLQQDRDHMLAVSGVFQRRITELAEMFLVLANRSLLARDEMGRYIVKAYGGNDPDSPESLAAVLKLKKSFPHQKEYAAIVDTILSWDKEDKPHNL